MPSGTLIYNFTKLKKEIFLEKSIFRGYICFCGGCSISRARYGNDEMIFGSKRHDKTPEFSFIKIPKSLFSAHKLIKAISGQSTEMLTTVLTIRNIVQLSTINIFYKTFFLLPVLTIRGATEHNDRGETSEIAKYHVITIHTYSK